MSSQYDSASETRPSGDSTGSEVDWDETILSVSDLKKHFPVNTGFTESLRFDGQGLLGIYLDDSVVRAVDGVSFDLRRGETFGIVGESGCGKSTLARTILDLEDTTSGKIRFEDRDVTDLDREQRSWFRKNVQMVFQDPQSSLNPRRSIGKIITDPLEAAGWDEEERKQRAFELLQDVGLSSEYYNRYPHEFSGGQRQRINLARALSINPDLLIADEPVSGLDMSVKAQILELMDDLQDEHGLTYLFITHDLGVVRNVADRVAVMYLGDFVEIGPTDELFTDPHHPYTRELLTAVPNPDPDTPPAQSHLRGDVPSPENPPTGCKFHTRCPEVILPEGVDRDTYREYAELRMDVVTQSLPPEESLDGLLDRYFTERPPGPLERAVDTALDCAGDDEWSAAKRALDEHATDCIATTPLQEPVSGPDHVSACHLPKEDREPFRK